MAVTTRDGHVKRAIEFYEKESLYISIGKPTEWAPEDSELGRVGGDAVVSDYNPVLPTELSPLPEPIGYKAVGTRYLVVPDEENGTISVLNRKWRIVTKDLATVEGARWVYVEGVIEFNQFSDNVVYRAVGVNSDLVPIDTAKSKQLLVPDEVLDPGTLEVIDYGHPIYRALNQRESIYMVIEF